MGVFCDRLKFGSTAALDKGRYLATRLFVNIVDRNFCQNVTKCIELKNRLFFLMMALMMQMYQTTCLVSVYCGIAQ